MIKIIFMIQLSLLKLDSKMEKMCQKFLISEKFYLMHFFKGLRAGIFPFRFYNHKYHVCLILKKVVLNARWLSLILVKFFCWIFLYSKKVVKNVLYNTTYIILIVSKYKVNFGKKWRLFVMFTNKAIISQG